VVSIVLLCEMGIIKNLACIGKIKAAAF